MELESIACNNCGAPLQVPTSANYVTCNHCATQLAVRREASISYTEKIDQIGERTDHLVQELAQVRFQQALDAIDRKWERDSKQYMIRGKHGHESLPSETAAILCGIGAAGALLFAIVGGVNGTPVALFAGVVSVMLGITALMQGAKASQYKKAHTRYQRRRGALSVAEFLPGGRLGQSIEGQLADNSEARVEEFLQSMEQDHAPTSGDR
jgi:hypothetical protein